METRKDITCDTFLYSQQHQRYVLFTICTNKLFFTLFQISNYLRSSVVNHKIQLQENVWPPVQFPSMASKLIKKKSGTKAASGRFQNISSDDLKSEANLLSIATSKSSMNNKKRANDLLTEFSGKVGFIDPFKVRAETSTLILNLLSEYCHTGKKEALSDDTMGALVQGLRALYLDHGHKGSWMIDVQSGSAGGNPLIGNEDLKKLRSNHRIHLSLLGRTKTRPRPLTMAQVCEHAEKYWFNDDKDTERVDYRDVILHAVLLIGLNLGMRFDEVQKVEIGHVTVHPGIVGTGSIILTINVKIKNSTIPRTYKLREWPGNTKMRRSLLCCPFTALLSWMSIRGNRPGYLFCHVSDKNMICTEKPWPVTEFTKFLRGRLRLCGVGPGDVSLYSGHSLKRGCVQLYRSLGMRDEHVMEIVQMSGDNAYANYCAAYNDCAPNELPRFNNLDAYIAHAETVKEEQGSGL